jgi:hypothetical protein
MQKRQRSIEITDLDLSLARVLSMSQLQKGVTMLKAGFIGAGGRSQGTHFILNEVKNLLHLNKEILRCALLDYQETTRNEFKH